MGISIKGLRKLVRNDRVFYWCVKHDDEDEGKLHLVIRSEDRKFDVSYPLDQKSTASGIIVKGNEFRWMDNLGHCWKRFPVPEWASETVAPALVARIIDWGLTPEGEQS